MTPPQPKESELVAEKIVCDPDEPLAESLVEYLQPEADEQSTEYVAAPLWRRGIAGTIDATIYLLEFASVVVGVFSLEFVEFWKYGAEPLFAAVGKAPIIGFSESCCLMICPMIMGFAYSILMLVTAKCLDPGVPHATIGKRLCGIATIYDAAAVWRGEIGFSVMKGLALITLLIVAATLEPACPWRGALLILSFTFWIPVVGLLYSLHRNDRPLIDDKIGRRVVVHSNAALDRPVWSHFGPALITVVTVVAVSWMYAVLTKESRYDLPCKTNVTNTFVVATRDIRPGETLRSADLRTIQLAPFLVPTYSVSTIDSVVGRNYWGSVKPNEPLCTPFTASSPTLTSAIINFSWRRYDAALSDVEGALRKDPNDQEAQKIRSRIIAQKRLVEE